jgi:hypothetical protein
MLRTINDIRAELADEGLDAPAPWLSFEDDEAEREVERRYRLRCDIEDWCRSQTIERIKIEYNPGFAKVGLHLVRLPNWKRT